jgi:hypothetical protein
LDGIFFSQRLYVVSLIECMESLCGAHLGYVIIFHMLSRGWIGFVFRSNKDSMKIPMERWYFDQHLLYAKLWHPLFDAKEEVVSSFPT